MAVAGIIHLKINGQSKEAKGEFTFNTGEPKLTSIVGADTVHGPKSEVTIPFIEGKLTFSDTLDLVEVTTLKNASVILELENGFTVVGKDMYYAADANVTTSEGEVPFRVESKTKLQIV